MQRRIEGERRILKPEDGPVIWIKAMAARTGFNPKMAQQRRLFADGYLRGYLGWRQMLMRREIEALESQKLLDAEHAAALGQEIAAKYRVAPVILGKTEIVEHGKKVVPASRDPLRRHPGSNNAPVSYVVYAITFEGDREILCRIPQEFQTGGPSADLTGRELQIEVNELMGGAAEMRAAFERTRQDIQQHLDWGRPEVDRHNREVLAEAGQRIERRRSVLLQHEALVAALGAPVRTAEQPLKAAPQANTGQGEPATPAAIFKPAEGRHNQDPKEMSAGQYERILDVLCAAGVAMERGPAAFERMSETQLRDQLLVALTTHYPATTAETFNGQGRTDILVRDGEENAFIGECKIWQGSGDLRDAMEQILRYATWRDTKAGIILFSRRKNISAVLEQIPEVFKAHRNFVRQETGYRRAGALRFVLTHGRDEDREMMVTVMVFQVAGKEREAVDMDMLID